MLHKYLHLDTQYISGVQDVFCKYFNIQTLIAETALAYDTAS